MQNLPTPSVVIFVASVPHVASFYESLAAMTRIVGDDEHVVLETAGFQLVIHKLRGAGASDAGQGRKVEPREDSYLKVCLPVRSIADARAIAAKHGGHVKPTKFEWEARGFRACDGHDPEGNILQVRESVSSKPSLNRA